MKRISIFSFLIFTMVLGSCEKFSLETDADTFYHLKVDEAIIPVWVKGNTLSKNLVVFINGGPGLTSIDVARMNLLGWEDYLEDHVGMVYYDQRGNGNAQGRIPQESLTLKHYLKDLKAVVLSLKAQYPDTRVFLMGHSFGGLIGQSFLLNSENAGLVSGWINVAGSTIVDSDKEWSYKLEFLEDLAIERMSDDSLKWSSALAWASANNPIVSKKQKEEWRDFIGYAGEGIIPAENMTVSAGDFLGVTFSSSYNVFPSYLSSNSSLVSYKLYTDTKGTNLLPELHRINLPNLTIWGKYDDVIPSQLGGDGFNALGTPKTQKKFVLLEASGHQPFINQPYIFQSEVIAFVNRI